MQALDPALRACGGVRGGRELTGLGVEVEITPSGAETVLHSFAGGGSDGANPTANLLQSSDGNLYGSTGAGGTSGYGTFFKVALQ